MILLERIIREYENYAYSNYDKALKDLANICEILKKDFWVNDNWNLFFIEIPENVKLVELETEILHLENDHIVCGDFELTNSSEKFLTSTKKVFTIQYYHFDSSFLKIAVIANSKILLVQRNPNNDVYD